MLDILRQIADIAGQQAQAELAQTTFGAVDSISVSDVGLSGSQNELHYTVSWSVTAMGDEMALVKMVILPEFLEGDEEDPAEWLAEQMSAFMVDRVLSIMQSDAAD